jgi:hypothetical protein
MTAVISFIGGVYSAFWIQQTDAERLGKALSVISSAVVPAGLLATLGGIFLTKADQATDTAEKRSLFYLESCIAAYEEARKLLADGNNDRATWIAAARALKHAEKLSIEVKVDGHCRVLELHRLKYRGFFNGILRARPAAFFYGAHDVSTPLAEAAAASSASEERAGRTITSTVKALAETSLHAIWKAAQWPMDYQDPLAGDRFSQSDEGPLMIFAPGLQEYLEHTRQYQSASGELWPRNQQEKPGNS